MVTQNIYEYKKVNPIDKKELQSEARDSGDYKNHIINKTIDKINELCIEQNHLMKDFELYKKAFKRHASGNLNDTHNSCEL